MDPSSGEVVVRFAPAMSSAPATGALADWLDAWRMALLRAAAPHVVAPTLSTVPGREGPTLRYPAPREVGLTGLGTVEGVVRAIPILGQVAEAIDALHAAGIVHGALGMESIWQLPDGSVALPDAALRAALPEDLPGGEGYATYLAPEQWHGAPPSSATDVYALGVVVYELVTGHRRAGAVTGGVASASALELDLFTPVVAHAPRQLVAALQRALASDPRMRFATARECIDACAAAIDVNALRTRARPNGPSTQLAWGWVVLGAAALALAVVGLLSVFS